jgi:KAP family P-loop domain
VSGDNPIKSSAADRLGRSEFAGHLAAALLGEAAADGLVAALVGPWGQGKTSVLNMVKEQLEGAHARTVLTFNPWMFSGRDQLVGVFFEQVAGQLRLKGKSEQALADRLVGYGQALSPLVFVPVAGAWFARASAVATAVGSARSARKRPDPIERQREAIEAALSKLTEPIIVFIDDIDRLTASEIRDMLGLVRLTAHFPKIIYLLAFDRAKVERALDQDGLDDGRSCLDKIVELSFDLPATPEHALENLLVQGLSDASAGIKTGPFDEALWADVLVHVLRPLLSTPRDIKRYLAALPAGMRMIGEEVALVDVLALEAIRLRLPEVFAMLGPMSHALTGIGMITSQAPGWQAEVETFVGAGGDHAEVVAWLCRLLFPPTVRYLGSSNITYPSSWLPLWRKQRKVANPEVLGIYLSRQLPPGALPATTVDAVVLAMPNKQVLQVLVDGMTTDDLDDLLARLVGYEEDVPSEAVLPACTVLLGLYPRLRTTSKGFFDPGPEIAVDRVVLQLLRRVSEIAERTLVVESLCVDVEGFNGRIRLLRLVGRRPNPQMDRLIPAAESDRLFLEVCHEIRHASAAQIAAERDPLLLLATALEEDPADRADVDSLLVDDTVATALLLSASAQIRAQSVGSVAMQTEQVLHWPLLGTVIGDNRDIEALVDRVAVQRADDGSAMAAVTLARRYLAGWRPSSFPFGSSQEPAIRQAFNHPNMIFSPSVLDGWPALLIRAVTTYEVDPAWASQADVSGAEFHRLLTGFLVSVSLAGQIAALATARNLPAEVGDWKPDQDAHQFVGAAVQRLILGPPDRPAAVLRYAVLLPDNTGPMRLMVDIALSPQQATDAEWGRLGLENIRDALAAAAESTAGPVADLILRAIYSGEMPFRTGVELYLWSAQGIGGTRPSNTLNDTIDLDELGPPTRDDRPAVQGMFAVAGNTPTTSSQDRRNLVVYALIRMALDWGYLDARARLAPLASG